jgi:hypothetical protein
MPLDVFLMNMCVVVLGLLVRREIAAFSGSRHSFVGIHQWRSSSFGLTKTVLFMSNWTVFKCFEKFAAQKWKGCLP